MLVVVVVVLVVAVVVVVTWWPGAAAPPAPDAPATQILITQKFWDPDPIFWGI